MNEEVYKYMHRLNKKKRIIKDIIAGMLDILRIEERLAAKSPLYTTFLSLFVKGSLKGFFSELIDKHLTDEEASKIIEMIKSYVDDIDINEIMRQEVVDITMEESE